MRVLAIVITCSVLFISGCADVKPWDRDLLAQKEMQLVPAPVDNALDEHVYFSKEAASGGQGVGGGGCGCN
jgi:hypothetical protein